jgi:imidazolonepropionase
MEIKSGYELTLEGETRLVTLAKEFSDEVTFLGAHVVPEEFANARDAYVELVAGSMLSSCEPHAKWADVFCDVGAFSVDEARTVLLAAKAAGLGLRLHANQLGHGGGVQLAVELEATSVDHCTYLSDEDVDSLANSSCVATLLPGAEFSTKSDYPDARRLLDAGVTVALATDCNPGTSYVTNMGFVVSLAVRDMGMSVDQALWSATRGGAMALGRDDIGLLAPGTRADFLILDAPTAKHVAYRAGSVIVRETRRSSR